MHGRIDRRRFTSLLPALALGGFAAGCTTVHPPALQLGDIDSDSVMLVGRIELLPALRSEEQDIKTTTLGDWDPFGVKQVMVNRAILYLTDRPDAPREPTRSVSNPPLEQLFFMRIPKRDRYVAHALVYLKHQVRVTSSRTADIDTTELWLPLRQELDIRPGDRALYIGTWRVQRDEFNEVTGVQVLDQYAAALAETRKRFGNDAGLRKALPKSRDTKLWVTKL